MRENLGLSRKELADKIGLGENSVWYYERGERTPNLETLLNLSEIFNVSVDELLTGEKSIERIRKFLVLDYRFKCNLEIAKQIGIEIISDKNKSEIKLSFPITKQIEKLPKFDGTIQAVKAMHLTFSDRDFFCEQFENWILESIIKEKSLLETVSDFIKNNFSEDTKSKKNIEKIIIEE